MKCLSKDESKKNMNNLSTHRIIIAEKWCYRNLRVVQVAEAP